MGIGGGPQPSAGRSLQLTLDAVASPIRREILWLVWDAELAAGEIAAAFDLTAGTISTHLAALRKAGLVEMRADGNFRRYRVNRPAIAALLPLLGTSDEKWLAADDLPERALAEATIGHWVTVGVDVPLTRPAAFESFVDPTRFSDWLGVPVTITDGHFAADMEWGTTVRGSYEVVAAPELIALRWDFEDEAVPVPGGQVVGYLRVTAKPPGCHVEIHQEAGNTQQAQFFSSAWSMVLGRFKEYADRGSRPSPRRAPRPKRSGSARPDS